MSLNSISKNYTLCFDVFSLTASSLALSQTSFLSNLSPRGIVIGTGVNALTLALTN